ncbi:putative mRNA-binding protein PUF3 [Blattamonas nauphoetae]|uniref:mRNA-binding protein PUF3 n=1 Tax=Blattamonas nauphoetae TaxID=2049346 RepID=A0ABQ9Y437_9EUKA|nr:putative mRNA-binding protein PUF3 [Blattamonas nauphoetae]
MEPGRTELLSVRERPIGRDDADVLDDVIPRPASATPKMSAQPPTDSDLLDRKSASHLPSIGGTHRIPKQTISPPPRTSTLSQIGTPVQKDSDVSSPVFPLMSEIKRGGGFTETSPLGLFGFQVMSDPNDNHSTMSEALSSFTISSQYPALTERESFFGGKSPRTGISFDHDLFAPDPTTSPDGQMQLSATSSLSPRSAIDYPPASEFYRMSPISSKDPPLSTQFDFDPSFSAFPPHSGDLFAPQFHSSAQSTVSFNSTGEPFSGIDSPRSMGFDFFTTSPTVSPMGVELSLLVPKVSLGSEPIAPTLETFSHATTPSPKSNTSGGTGSKQSETYSSGRKSGKTVDTDNTLLHHSNSDTSNRLAKDGIQASPLATLNQRKTPPLNPSNSHVASFNSPIAKIRQVSYLPLPSSPPMELASFTRLTNPQEADNQGGSWNLSAIPFNTLPNNEHYQTQFLQHSEVHGQVQQQTSDISVSRNSHFTPFSSSTVASEQHHLPSSLSQNQPMFQPRYTAHFPMSPLTRDSSQDQRSGLISTTPLLSDYTTTRTLPTPAPTKTSQLPPTFTPQRALSLAAADTPGQSILFRINQTIQALSVSPSELNRMTQPAIIDKSNILLSDLTSLPSTDSESTVFSICSSPVQLPSVQHAIQHARGDLVLSFLVSIKPFVINLISERTASGVIHSFLTREEHDRREQRLASTSPSLQLTAVIFDAVHLSFANLCCGRNSCRALQNLVTIAPYTVTLQYIPSIQPKLTQIMKDINGNHCIQMIIKQTPPEHRNWIVDTLLDLENTPQSESTLADLCCHVYSCRVIQTLVEDSTEAQKHRLFIPLAVSSERLAMDAYGNYIVQRMLECDDNIIVQNACMYLTPNIALLCTSKFGSNVAEKVVIKTHPSRLTDVVLHLVGLKEQARVLRLEASRNTNPQSNEEIRPIDTSHLHSLLPQVDNSKVLIILTDQFGNYVMQRVLERAQGELLSFVMSVIERVWDDLMRSQHGRHVCQTVERMKRGETVFGGFGNGRTQRQSALRMKSQKQSPQKTNQPYGNHKTINYRPGEVVTHVQGQEQTQHSQLPVHHSQNSTPTTQRQFVTFTPQLADPSHPHYRSPAPPTQDQTPLFSSPSYPPSQRTKLQTFHQSPQQSQSQFSYVGTAYQQPTSKYTGKW